MPFAGFSPSCWVVLVQMEHWADTLSENSEKLTMNKIISTHFFIQDFEIQIYA